ncbi:type IV pilus assembly protein PilC [Thermosyntropha lipolytica DSM 11003]|uniref:Type IV pilus assembly protein PilC n=1 Tax=Thermosyntropha lipolytica DSM 11003 TaxID=1123382 RepID=A0A1M5LMP8_9FIRM|nr:type II secretion system F family protein [Thermosyntropha lipolytica]SHG66347.1 type IV pilus assembly protein PilC [Thermosyntropha lipolytica DSM 11003]
MEYRYKVRDMQGQVLTGVLEAENREAVIRSLLNQNYYITKLEEVGSSSRKVELSLTLGRVPTRDLVLMTRQLSTMLAAGLSILRAFNILIEQTENKTLKKALTEVRDDIESGLPLYQALAKHPRIFSKVYVSMVRAGELGGVLEGVLERLSEHLEREEEINSKVKTASIYPSIIAVFALIAVFFIITFIMPTFVGMFESAGAALPRPTEILYHTGLFLQSSWYLVIAGIVLLVVVLKGIGRTEGGRMFFDTLYLKIPVIGRANAKIITARFARTMGILLRSGIPVLQALEVVEDVVGNVYIARALKEARESISEGDYISYPLAQAGIFEPMVVQMIAVGEETGALDAMLIRLSDYFEREVMHTVDALMAMIEPALIILVALLVGGVVVSTLLPVFEMINVVGQGV